MIPRVVYDTMLYFQAAAQEPPRLHGTFQAVEKGTVQLCLSNALFDEVTDVLSRPEMREKAPSLTPERVASFLTKTRSECLWAEEVPQRFTLPGHPDDDHFFNLAIAVNADFLVTWENRLLALDNPDSVDGQRLRSFVPQLRIITPTDLVASLRSL